ncbi:conserved Plasmodium protein, unknown function [Plasmodium knowlesi strain H]|uniref:Uncharacterized protein n=3 Tax=Plasmodium knowlesi TaxID=5850 RepID=A0A5K1UPT8_PLAKH|nr:conserved Plasmodium protein, unknown function [Plasmodium knowlesi strain H]OTN67235.1 Uncharacterized protein PKNOH_S06426600 [Plasmodium knowlesi]CAA9987537.1 conserved Plasmodium protein, unknown function [Plasmodium knowlesi strain H]SBO23100.1 conserved Plasmodium protein, unknown function [Plasmodium knowlesi strain H]SBO23756.1 conserved Plasmodium protein, unknown function [Plasmodium knowlesi strain H]VVS77011.1 conserved Plasmodium protein, unknown function [Plasmodium knowlesi s|eukprot:XP_002258539.1 hypothetical protein, conserved in Plasmodium species [Plasmodium knowlesi strain H]
MAKSTDSKNLFLLNSIHSLILLIFMEIFFFLLDGINTFEVITIEERISQMIWCFFFVVQIGILKVAEVFSKNANGKEIVSVHYLFIIYVFLFPLSSSLLLTSALSWSKTVYFICILSLSTSVKIKGLLLICTVTLITGFVRFYNDMPTFHIALCFTLLLLLHIVVCFIVHLELYTLAREIAYIKKKPLRALDSVDPYFQELEKKAILIRNNLIYCQQNNISVDILGNNPFEYEENEGIKKIKTINQSKIRLDPYGDDLTSVKCEAPLDVSDVNCSSVNNFDIGGEKQNLQNESASSFQREESLSVGHKSRDETRVGKVKGRRKVHALEESMQVNNRGGEQSAIADIHRPNRTRSDGKNYHLINDLPQVKHLASKRHRSGISKKNLSNLNSLNGRTFGDKLEISQPQYYEETYKKEMVQRHFSLLRSGLGRFNRRRNIILSEELKKNITYIYFDRDGKVKRSQIIPVYVLERHNLSNISCYLRSNHTPTRNGNQYKMLTRLKEYSGLKMGVPYQGSPHMNSLGGLRNGRNKGRDTQTATPTRSHSSVFLADSNENRHEKDKLHVFNSDELRTEEKRKASNNNHGSSCASVGECRRRGDQSEVTNQGPKSTRMFYLIPSPKEEEEDGTKGNKDPNCKAKKKGNYLFHSQSTSSDHDGSATSVKSKSLFHVNTSIEKDKYIIQLQDSSDDNLSTSNNVLYVDDVVDGSSGTEMGEDSGDGTANCGTSSDESVYAGWRNRRDGRGKYGDAVCLVSAIGERHREASPPSERPNGEQKIERKRSNCYYGTKFSLKKKKMKKNESHSEVASRKEFLLQFYDVISTGGTNELYGVNKKRCHHWKGLLSFVNIMGNFFKGAKLGVTKWGYFSSRSKGGKYWTQYNKTFSTAEWRQNIRDSELEYILKYKNFTKWYRHWVSSVLFHYYKNTQFFALLLLLLNVLTVLLQMMLFSMLIRVDNAGLKSPNPFYNDKPLFMGTKFSINNTMDDNIFYRLLSIRIPMQIALNVLLILPSFVVKNYRHVNWLNICSTLNCLVNIIFGTLDISYSVNNRLYNIEELHPVLNYYNIFDLFLVGKLTMSIFLIPFVTNFNGSKTNALVTFSCFCYIGTFYGAFNPSSFSIKLMYITNFVILIATAASTVHYSRLIAKSRKMLFVKYVLPYFIYLTFLSTDPNIQMEIKEKRRGG